MNASSTMYFPDVGQILATSTTQVTNLVAWALPGIIILIGIAVGGMVLMKARRAIISGVARGIGAGRRRGGRRRR